MNPFWHLAGRIFHEKPSPEEQAGLFPLFAIYFGVGALTISYARHFLDSLSVLTLTVAAAIAGSVLVFVVPKIWGDHVPAKVSWVIGAIAWSVLFLLAVTGRLGWYAD
jgi:hypothetical protein